VWHVKEPSLLKAGSAKHRSKFAAVTGNGDSRQIVEELFMQLETNKLIELKYMMQSMLISI
jgi:hypothetical protein